MKSIFPLFLLLALFAPIGCSDDTAEPLEALDISGPEFTRVTWIGYPWVDNEPTGEISNGSHHIMSLEADFFQLNLQVEDENFIAKADCYFTVNNDPEIKETILERDPMVGLKEFSLGFSRHLGWIQLGIEGRYYIEVGDTFQFYLNFIDEFGNESSMSWTAEIVE